MSRRALLRFYWRLARWAQFHACAQVWDYVCEQAAFHINAAVDGNPKMRAAYNLMGRGSTIDALERFVLSVGDLPAEQGEPWRGERCKIRWREE